MNIVFDFGAVLFTWQPVVLAAQHFPTQAATTAQAGHLAHEIFAHADWQAFDRGTLHIDEVITRTATRLQLDHAALHHLVHGIGDYLVPMADSVQLLEDLHARRQSDPSLRLYYLSNMPVPYARVLEARHGFLKRFDGGVFSGDVLQIKPEPAIYQTLEDSYGLMPQDTVFLDDLLPNIAAAQARGWHGIHFKSADDARAQLTHILGK